jgi:hypothetical protein
MRSEIQKLESTVADQKIQLFEAEEAIRSMTPRVIAKQSPVSGRGPPTWPIWVVEMIMELLSHRTPPSCISANILTIANIMFPNHSIIKELPSTNFIRETRSVLSNTTKSLAAYQLGQNTNWVQAHGDGTSRRHTTMENTIVAMETDTGLKTITLNNCIIAKDGTAESVTEAMVKSFTEAGELLDEWRATTVRMFPTRQDLHDMIPTQSDLSIAKLKDANVMTDTCNTARKHRRLMIEAIKKAALDSGMSVEDITAFEGDCWHHLRNIWFGAVILRLSKTLEGILGDDLELISSIYRVASKMNVTELLRAIEKEFALTAMYAKGHGSMFKTWMMKHHPSALLYPVARALGGNRQDIGIEGAPAVYMNLGYYLQFLHWRLTITTENILQKSLFYTLRSIEMIALLRVLSILHISVCLPTRWLTGNTHELATYNFGMHDMARVADMLEKAMEVVVSDGSKFLDEDFIMNIFQDITKQVDPFKDYLAFIFEEKQSYPVGSRSEEDAVLPFDQLRAELFYPERDENRKSYRMACRLAEEAATTILTELRDPSKATSHYLSSLDGIRSWKNLSEEQKKQGLKKAASNSISESNHAAATIGLQTWGTIRFDYAAAEGQTRMNNDLGRGHLALVTGKQSKSGPIERVMGSYHNLPRELKDSLIQTGRKNARTNRKKFDDALAAQYKARQEKEEIKMRLKIDSIESEYIVAIYFHEQYHSPRCWKTVDIAQQEYEKLKSKTKKMEAVKEQILIRLNGLGWEKAHHPWSRGPVIYSVDDLFKHLIETVIPLAATEIVPTEPPLKLPEPPPMQKLGTTAEIAMELENGITTNREAVKKRAHEERDRREAMGKGDRWMEQQRTSMPIIDNSLIGFKIEKLFEYTEPDGSVVLNWCFGKVVKIKNQKTNMVIVQWDNQFVDPGDPNQSPEKLLETKWNPTGVHTKGAWREYLRA